MVRVICEAMAHLSDVEKIIIRIKSWVSYLRLSKNKLAGQAGIAESTLREFEHKDWNPTLSTIKKLETAVPKGSPPKRKS